MYIISLITHHFTHCHLFLGMCISWTLQPAPPTLVVTITMYLSTLLKRTSNKPFFISADPIHDFLIIQRVELLPHARQAWDKTLLRQDLDKFHVSLRRKQFFDKCLGTSTQLDTTDTTLLHNNSSEDLDESFGITKFSNPSTWCPLGPPNLETMLTLNEVNLNTILLYAPGSHNLNRSEQCTLAELQHVQSGVIKRADKGGISKKDYTNSMTSTR